MLCIFALMTVAMQAQTMNTLPTVTPEGTAFDDEVTLTCTFPEGCEGGKYWLNNGQILAKEYTGPIHLTQSATFSVAGTDADGRIITDIVTRYIKVNRVTPPSYVTTPAEGIRQESFYVTVIEWQHVTRVTLQRDPFKEGGSRYGENAILLINPQGEVCATNTINGLWEAGENKFKAYINKNYKQEALGDYELHIAGGVFIIDGTLYDQELVLHYTVSDVAAAPSFTPASGTYEAPLTVTINYPTDGSAFWKLYKINDGAPQSYTAPLTLTESATVEAWGMDENYETPTPTTTATYTLTEPVPVPEPLPAPVMKYEGSTVTISAEAGTTVKYWLNDRMQTAKVYDAPITVSENCRISCVAYTADRKSPTVRISVTDRPKDRGDYGENILLSPDHNEQITINAVSPNGLYAVGTIGTDTSAKGFIWNISANTFTIPTQMYTNQFYSVSDDGTAFGWRARSTSADEDGGEGQLMWGICKNGQWQEVPQGMRAKGITSDGRIYGSVDNAPATYDFDKKEIKLYPATAYEEGTITASSADGTILAGHIIMGNSRYAVIWRSETESQAYEIGDADTDITVKALSADGRWALIGDKYRLQTETGMMEFILSTDVLNKNNLKPEVLRAIANDGTAFGTFDESLLDRENGEALVLTTDNRWVGAEEWMMERYDLDLLKDYTLRSIRAVSGDGQTLIFHCLPKGGTIDNFYTRGLLIGIDVQVKHLAPTSLKAEQVSGMETIRLSWQAPLYGAEDISSYTILRNGTQLATIAANAEKTYHDETVTAGMEYTYTVTATYKDGTVSKASNAAVVMVVMERYLPVRDLKVRQFGLSDVSITWSTPRTTLPKLQYFDEEAEWQAFGTGASQVDAEFGIRIPKSEMTGFEGKQIRTFQFLPTGPQAAYTLNFYKGAAISGNYDATPFYSQDIDPASLNYGKVNVIELTTPQNLPENADLYVGLLIKNVGDNNMLGISYEGFKKGYTDLCRIVGVYDKMLSIADMSQDAETDIVLPLGIGVCDEAALNGALISNYSVTFDGQPLATTSDLKVRQERVTEGEHTYTVSAIYRDGKVSAAESLTFTLANNDAAYVPVNDLTINVGADNKATIEWQAPLDEDRTLIHYGDLEPREGWVMSPGFDGFTAGAIFPVTMTGDYADDYAITDLYFCPTAEAEFEIMLTDEMGKNYAYKLLTTEDVTLGEVNTIHLDEPVIVNPSVNYWMYVNVTSGTEGTAPLAYDSSNEWVDWYSNIFNYGAGISTLAEIASHGEHPNWLMGMVVRQTSPKTMPLDGYDILIDGVKANATPLTTTSFTSAQLDKGTHTASVRVVYTPAKSVEGRENAFEVTEASGITSITTNDTPAAKYNIAGQRISTPKGLYIQNGKTKTPSVTK